MSLVPGGEGGMGGGVSVGTLKNPHRHAEECESNISSLA